RTNDTRVISSRDGRKSDLVPALDGSLDQFCVDLTERASGRLHCHGNGGRLGEAGREVHFEELHRAVLLHDGISTRDVSEPEPLVSRYGEFADGRGRLRAESRGREEVG